MNVAKIKDRALTAAVIIGFIVAGAAALAIGVCFIWLCDAVGFVM